MGRVRIKNADMIKALIEHKGNVSQTAKALGCSRETVHKRIRENAKVNEAYVQGRMEMRDLGESNLLKALQAGEWKATYFVLTHMTPDGKIQTPRQQMEISGVDGEAIPIKHIVENRPE